MADKTFATVLPPLLAKDNGDGTYSVAVSIMDPLSDFRPGNDDSYWLGDATHGWKGIHMADTLITDEAGYVRLRNNDDDAFVSLKLGQYILMDSTEPAIRLRENDQAADAGNWQLLASGGTFYVQSATDLWGGTTLLSIARTGLVSIGVGAPGHGPTGLYVVGSVEFDADVTFDFPAHFKNTVNMEQLVYILERAAAGADKAGYGQLWVKNTTPCELWFTDDAGTDTQIV